MPAISIWRSASSLARSLLLGGAHRFDLGVADAQFLVRAVENTQRKRADGKIRQGSKHATQNGNKQMCEKSAGARWSQLSMLPTSTLFKTIGAVLANDGLSSRAFFQHQPALRGYGSAALWRSAS